MCVEMSAESGFYVLVAVAIKLKAYPICSAPVSPYIMTLAQCVCK